MDAHIHQRGLEAPSGEPACGEKRREPAGRVGAALFLRLVFLGEQKNETRRKGAKPQSNKTLQAQLLSKLTLSTYIHVDNKTLLHNPANQESKY